MKNLYIVPFTAFTRELWYNYKSEFFFGIILLAVTIFSYWFGAYIPKDLFENVINPFEYISIITVCFFGGVLVVHHIDGNPLRKSWAWVLFTWGVIEFGLYIARYVFGVTAIGGTPDDPLFNSSVAVGNMFAWLLFVYPSQVLRPGWLNLKRALMHLTPLLILAILDYYLPFSLLSVIMIYPFLIFVTVCVQIRQYRQWCENNFSSMDEIDAQWIVRYLVILFLLGLSYYFICFWYVPNRMFTQQWLLLLILSYTTREVLFRPYPWTHLIPKRDASIKELPHDYMDNPTENAMEQDTTDHNAQRVKLEQWIEAEKPYLNPNFQLMDLREVLPMNRTYLSKFINDEYGCSFFQFVNHYRVVEAKKLMASAPEMKIGDIATNTGFSSPTVFSRTFARETGMSPREWSSSIQND
jgi:AraC-like DNA-binding protein